jgi:hypothetical protein
MQDDQSVMPRERAATASVSPELLRLPFEGSIEAGENNIVELERKLHFIVTPSQTGGSIT